MHVYTNKQPFQQIQHAEMNISPLKNPKNMNLLSSDNLKKGLICPPNIKQKKVLHKISADQVGIRGVKTKAAERPFSNLVYGLEIDKSHKINNLLLQTATMAANNVKEKNSGDGNSSKGLHENIIEPLKYSGNPEARLLKETKSSTNLLYNTASMKEYERLNQKINRNKQLIEELKRTTRKDDIFQKNYSGYLNNVKESIKPVFSPTDKETKLSQIHSKTDKHIETYGFPAPKIESQKFVFRSTPLIERKNVQQGKAVQPLVISLSSSLTFKSEGKKADFKHETKSPPSGKMGIDQFKIGKKLGQGRYGTVSMVLHKKTLGMFALKKISKAVIKSKKMASQSMMQIRLQSCLHHSNILSMYGFFDDKTHLFVVLEYMEGGTLYERLRKQGKIVEREVAVIVKQITTAIEYMHDLGIAHRDIKPQNIVITNNVYKLCDFGWATLCKERRTTYCGTIDYVAPEILEGIEYDMSVDLWCLGVLTFELLTGKAPFYCVSQHETRKKILNVDNKNVVYPESISVNARDFIDRLIRKQPTERLKAAQALEHSFLKQVSESNNDSHI